MAEVTVQFQATPNPNAGKFVVDRAVVEGEASQSFFNEDDAQGNPLAEALMEVDGVDSLFMVEDFVTVTKTLDADWQELIPIVEETIRQNL